MKKYILLTIIALPLFADAAYKHYVCDMQKGEQASDGTITAGPVFGKASVIDKGASFFVFVEKGLSIQSPELTKNGKTLNGYADDGTGFVKGDGFFFIGDERSGYIFVNCKKI